MCNTQRKMNEAYNRKLPDFVSSSASGGGPPFQPGKEIKVINPRDYSGVAAVIRGAMNASVQGLVEDGRTLYKTTDPASIETRKGIQRVLPEGSTFVLHR